MEIAVFSRNYFTAHQMIDTLKRKVLKPLVMSAAGLLFKITDNHSLERYLTVFVYHDVTNYPSEFSRQFSLNVSPAVFEYQINFIKSKFNIISPDDLLSQSIPPKAALITFDDGFRSYFKSAVPILEKYKVPSILFLNMEPVKGGIFWSGLITYLCDRDGDFKKYAEESLQAKVNNVPLFLTCSRKIVDSYIRETGKSFEKEVSVFVGEFATEEDLHNASGSPFIFYGNHLFNHYVPLLLSDGEFLESYSKNAIELKGLPNYRNVFSFPFGQPGTCYSEEQVKLLLANGVKKVFSSSGFINPDILSPYLDRISLTSFHSSPARIGFQVCQRSFRKRLGILGKEFNG